MKKSGKSVTLDNVRAVYDGAEGILWELIMGEQIHVGGFASSMELAKRAGISANTKGIDLCSALGAGCRFLVKFFGVKMVGLDATDTMLIKSKQRAEAEGYGKSIEFRKGDVSDIPYKDGEFDFVWGEDAWCYVVDKPRLISESARVIKPGGTVAFTDWIIGPKGMSGAELNRVCSFMTFPNLQSLEGYKKLLSDAKLKVIEAEDKTPEFAGYVQLYLRMLSEQLTFDALKIIGFDENMFRALGAEMAFMGELAAQGKMGRGRFIAKK